MSKVKDFTDGKIFSPLVKFIIPIFAALFLQTMYGAVDLLIVGRFGNAADVSAVSTGSQIMQVITLTITGLAMGQKLGQGKKKDAGNVVGSGISIFAVIAIILTVVFVTFARIATAYQIQNRIITFFVPNLSSRIPINQEPKIPTTAMIVIMEIACVADIPSS